MNGSAEQPGVTAPPGGADVGCSPGPGRLAAGTAAAVAGARELSADQADGQQPDQADVDEDDDEFEPL